MKENKVYLNTIEDLTKALSEGKIVYDNRGGGRKYKMINGILTEEEEGNLYINYGFSFQKDMLYILEKAPLKIEVGKFYETRDGHKAICVYKSQNPSDKDKPFAMSIIGSSYSYYVLSTGEAYLSGDDIVDYWEDTNE